MTIDFRRSQQSLYDGRSDRRPLSMLGKSGALWGCGLTKAIPFATIGVAVVALSFFNSDATESAMPLEPAATHAESIGLPSPDRRPDDIADMAMEPAATHDEGAAYNNTATAPAPAVMPLEPAASHTEDTEIATAGDEQVESLPLEPVAPAPENTEIAMLPPAGEIENEGADGMDPSADVGDSSGAGADLGDGSDMDSDWGEAPVAPEPIRRTVSVERRDTIMAVLLRAGVARDEAHAVVAALRAVYDPRRLRPGQKIELEYMAAYEGPEQLVSIRLDPTIDVSILVTRADGKGYTAKEEKRELVRELAMGAGQIKSSLYVTGVKDGVPPTVMIDLIRIFSFDVDFQRDIHPGDSFEVLYERFRDESGERARVGDIRYVSLTLSGTRHRLWLHDSAKHGPDYFDEKGRSSRKALMRTPIDGARISSSFGRRRHPILGYNRMHQGTDFAAPRGTPVYAAGNGVVEKAGRLGGYGNYVRLRHNNNYKSAYAHLRRFAKGIRPGVRVRQGQTIAYVGSTGRSTGPHLHYEVIHNGKKINTQKMRLPSGRTLKGKELVAFEATRSVMDSQFAALAAEGTEASANIASVPEGEKE